MEWNCTKFFSNFSSQSAWLCIAKSVVEAKCRAACLLYYFTIWPLLEKIIWCFSKNIFVCIAYYICKYYACTHHLTISQEILDFFLYKRFTFDVWTYSWSSWKKNWFFIRSSHNKKIFICFFVMSCIIVFKYSRENYIFVARRIVQKTMYSL